MKAIIITNLLVLIFIKLSYSQITITDSDMPGVGDIFVTSQTNNVNSYFDSTGVNYYWNFSDLQPNNQRVDTFISSFSTNAAYAVVFFNTMAVPGADFPNLIPQITITDVYDFFKTTSGDYTKHGMGAKVNTIPMPMEFDNPMIIYTLPLYFGNIDSSISSYGLTIPSFGYYGQTIKRKNYTDGWGTIETPYGIFNVLRVRSEVQTTDTFYYDAFGFGTSNQRDEQIFQWISNNMGIPVLTVTKTNMQTRAVYLDSLLQTNENSIAGHDLQIEVYPNPANDHIQFNSNLPFDIEIYNNLGQKVLTERIINNYLNISELKKGAYTIRINSEKLSCYKKLIISK